MKSEYPQTLNPNDVKPEDLQNRLTPAEKTGYVLTALGLLGGCGAGAVVFEWAVSHPKEVSQLLGQLSGFGK